jgi:hypothetical protein
MRQLLRALVIAVTAAPAQAQLTTTYTGTQLVGDKQVPATAKFSVEQGRVAMVMTGGRGGRMVYDAKNQVLHIIMDESKSYFDITKAGGAGDAGGMAAEMQKQLEKMPKEQRAAAEQMMKGMMGSVAPPPPLTYVWSHETKTVAGYECTRVDGMRGDTKVTEYCGTTSSDFKMSDGERQTMLDMQGYLRNFGISVQAGDETRAFQWDTSVDGFPIVTRCYRDGKMTLDLVLESVNRKPIPDELFDLPRGYRKIDMAAMGGRRPS